MVKTRRDVHINYSYMIFLHFETLNSFLFVKMFNSWNQMFGNSMHSVISFNFWFEMAYIYRNKLFYWYIYYLEVNLLICQIWHDAPPFSPSWQSGKCCWIVLQVLLVLIYNSEKKSLQQCVPVLIRTAGL